jgi:acetylornithine deacetylase
MERLPSGLIDEAELVGVAQQLVRFASPQTDKMEAEPAVQSFISDCVMPMLASRALTGTRDAMGNLVVDLGDKDADRSMLLMAYAMTHPASAMTDPYSGRLVQLPEGKAVRGRGISEQKGALAAAIVALAAVNKIGKLRGRLVFALSSAGETGRHDAAAAIVGGLGSTPKLGVLALGTNNKVSLGNKGRLDIEITVRGKATHSSTAWLGVNAIDGARVVMDRLAALPLGAAAHPELGEASLNSTHISSRPNATHTIQNEVHLTFDRRLLPGQDPDVPFHVITEAVAAIGGPWQIEVKRGPFMYPCEISQNGPLFQAILAARKLLGKTTAPETLYSHGALDAGYLLKHGCDTTMWGPGRMEQFHADAEHLLVTELVRGAEDYLALIASYLVEP